MFYVCKIGMEKNVTNSHLILQSVQTKIVFTNPVSKKLLNFEGYTRKWFCQKCFGGYKITASSMSTDNFFSYPESVTSLYHTNFIISVPFPKPQHWPGEWKCWSARWFKILVQTALSWTRLSISTTIGWIAAVLLYLCDAPTVHLQLPGDQSCRLSCEHVLGRLAQNCFLVKFLDNYWMDCHKNFENTSSWDEL